MPKLVHPNLPGQLIDVSERTARVYARSGWTPASVESLVDTSTREELDELADTRDLDPSDYRTKTDLASALVDDED